MLFIAGPDGISKYPHPFLASSHLNNGAKACTNIDPIFNNLVFKLFIHEYIKWVYGYGTPVLLSDCA
jgi:hypothetical protein